jgi:alpha-L-fucosidase
MAYPPTSNLFLIFAQNFTKMKKLHQILSLLLTAFVIQGLTAQHHQQTYVPDTSPLVNQKLDQWADMKFGLLMHWGPYSQWGVVESWSICNEDEDWCRRKTDNYIEYKKNYEDLKLSFNPVRFDPSKWAKAASQAGMKYVVFTTKHHDGFCMYDSRYTNYKATDTACPFHVNKRADIAREVFDAFRAEGMWAGAYFSKPDWHCTDYWWPNFATPDRNVNYEIDRYPERWERYVQFTHNQLLELVTNYGPLDLVWLDGGWVQKLSDEHVAAYKNDPAYRFQKIQSQDIRMDELKTKLRAVKPDLIVVDRAVEGPNQNYLTPENTVPTQHLPYPWESCIIAGGSWSWVPDAKYLSSRKVIHTLSEIVAKGGNLLLNIAPGPDGTWDEGAYQMLEAVGNWMKINGNAIYNTRAVKPYREGKFAWTEAKDGTRYAIYLAGDDEPQLPEKVMMYEFFAKPDQKITLSGNDTPLQFISSGDGTVVKIPIALRGFRTGTEAWVFEIK